MSSTLATAPSAVLVDPVLVLADVRSDAERELIERWARSEHPGAEVLDQRDPALARRLERGDDPLIMPARVTWLPGRRAGRGRVPLSELMVLSGPRRPWTWAQRVALRVDPELAQVTAGEPAHAIELRRRFRAEGRTGSAAFAVFVARQATLACERAQRGILGDRYKVPRLVAEQIAASRRFRGQVASLAERLGRPEREVLAAATGCLEEIAAVQSPLAVDVYRSVLRPLHAKAWTIDADVEGLERLRALNREHPLVFLPSHRSYVDPLVLGEVLHAHDFPPNHVLGGNNMSFWPLGPLCRRAGVVWIRRSFGDDAIYKLAVRAYVGHLAAKRFNFEWYIEGGRTRTGKLRPPRYGLLRYLIGALDDGYAEDVILVPTSIVYDQLREAEPMAAEQGGGAKSPEGLRWLAGYHRAQRRPAGAARVRFGEPLSLRDALAAAGDGPTRTEKVAFTICDGINRATPFTASSLVTFALLGARDRALTFADVRRSVAPVLAYVEARGLEVAGTDLRQDTALRATLEALTQSGVLSCYTGGAEPVWSIAPDRHRLAAFYRNGAVHHFVNRAIGELALLDADSDEAAWEEALRLRDLLKFEFFFADKRRFADELRAEQALVADPRLHVAHRALGSFVDAQLVFAERLAARDPSRPVDRDELVRECLGFGRQLVLQGRLYAPESVARDLYEAAWRLAENRGLLEPGRAAERAAFRDEVASVAERIRRIGEIDARGEG